jgi:hypothetical protein
MGSSKQAIKELPGGSMRIPYKDLYPSKPSAKGYIITKQTYEINTACLSSILFA